MVGVGPKGPQQYLLGLRCTYMMCSGIYNSNKRDQNSYWNRYKNSAVFPKKYYIFCHSISPLCESSNKLVNIPGLLVTIRKKKFIWKLKFCKVFKSSANSNANSFQKYSYKSTGLAVLKFLFNILNLNHPFKKNDTVTLRKTAVTKNRKLFIHFPNLRHWQVAFCSICRSHSVALALNSPYGALAWRRLDISIKGWNAVLWIRNDLFRICGFPNPDSAHVIGAYLEIIIEKHFIINLPTICHFLFHTKVLYVVLY